jgi:hypothetical protein
MKQNSLFHILRFLHFSDNRNEPDETDENYDRLWKMRTIFGKLNTMETQMVSGKNLQSMAILRVIPKLYQFI